MGGGGGIVMTCLTCNTASLPATMSNDENVVEDQLEPVGDVQQHFALMLHARLVDLETEVRALRPASLDPRVRLLGTATTADSGAVFVRVRSRRHVEFDPWCEAVLRRLAATDTGVRFDAWCCQHWSLAADDRPYVVEALVERSCGPADVAKVAHAALDATPGGLVEACAVVCPRWFAESIRCAATTVADPPPVLHTWDPEAGAVVRHGMEDETGAGGTPGQVAAWTLLHGWLASHVERTDVWHPRALSASATAVELIKALGARLLE